MKNTKKKGFTIVELVIVIAVIAILAAVAIPTFTTVIDKANQSAALQEAKSSFDVFLADNTVDGVLPTPATTVIKKGGKFYTFKCGADGVVKQSGDAATTGTPAAWKTDAAQSGGSENP